MANINRKAVVIRYDGKPIYVAQVLEFSSDDLLKATKEAQQNLLELEGNRAHIINLLIDKVEKLEKEIAHLKGED